MSIRHEHHTITPDPNMVDICIVNTDKSTKNNTDQYTKPCKLSHGQSKHARQTRTPYMYTHYLRNIPNHVTFTLISHQWNEVRRTPSERYEDGAKEPIYQI